MSGKSLTRALQKGSKTGNGIGPTKYEQATCGRYCAQVTLKYPAERAQEAQPTQGTNTGGMPDTYIPDDKAEPLVLQAGYERRGFLLRLLPWLVLIGMIGFVALSLKSCSASDEGQVRVGAMAPEAARTDRVETQTSQEYRKNLARYSEDKARVALAKGESFVAPAADVRKKPVPVPVPAPEPREKPNPPDAPPAREQARPQQTQQLKRPVFRETNVRSVKNEQDKTAPMRAYLAGIKTRDPQVQLALVLNEPSPKEVTHVGEESPASGLPGLKVGDILQCVNRVTLDSDAPGPAMVEVVSGPYRGARVVGSFQRLNEHLVLRFSELAAPDGSVHNIAGFAIDPATDRTAVRTDVDNHVLERWGGLVAASFLEGFGEAVERSGTSAHTTIYGSGWSVPDYSLGEEMWIAAGKAGERAANALDRGFGRAPTVTLESGTAMGVLLLRLPRTGSRTVTPRVVRQDTGAGAGIAGEIAEEQARARGSHGQNASAQNPPAGTLVRTFSGDARASPLQR